MPALPLGESTTFCPECQSKYHDTDDGAYVASDSPKAADGEKSERNKSNENIVEENKSGGKDAVGNRIRGGVYTMRMRRSRWLSSRGGKGQEGRQAGCC
jgi:hypothetical protein